MPEASPHPEHIEYHRERLTTGRELALISISGALSCGRCNMSQSTTTFPLEHCKEPDCNTHWRFLAVDDRSTVDPDNYPHLQVVDKNNIVAEDLFKHDEIASIEGIALARTVGPRYGSPDDVLPIVSFLGRTINNVVDDL